ncbi:MAG: hypothetical protein V4546_11090 [Bacteroidota bacterium]|uniref:KTSC domain-containing protein n=1 Tax=Pedobacter cryotolerans TaxID=2571270 RepID=A0A4U1CA31_9SPHI|nr:hypothetical protein [Pedobacter cryotolerans]TKC02641.1 hypothetical protein FA045_05030 [Pedobacter cryotolerans]
MKKLLLVILMQFVVTVAISQTVKCNDLLDFIITKGYKKATFTSFTLGSSWLSKVTAYTYDYKVYVVADIKESEYSFKTKSYLFCGIPNSNWQSFQYGGYGIPTSYGERFHKYIIDYKCDCN